jgi:hypothetical protein
MRQADDSLREAGILRDADAQRGAVNRAYYARALEDGRVPQHPARADGAPGRGRVLRRPAPALLGTRRHVLPVPSHAIQYDRLRLEAAEVE